MAALKDVSPLQLLLHQRNLDKDVTQVCSTRASLHFHLHVRLDWHWFIRYFLQDHQFKEFLNTVQNSFSQTTMCDQLILLLLKFIGFSGLLFTGTMGSNSQNLRNAYPGEFLSLCLANQGLVIHATPLEAVCFAHCTYHLVWSPRS